jgi:alanine racemase
MHTNSIIELNNTAYQKNLSFLRTTFGKSTNFMCCKMLTATDYRNRFNGVQNGITHFSVFDVEAKIVKAELGDNATILVMGLVQDEDMEWVINNDVEFLFLIRRLMQAENCKRCIKGNYTY